MSLPAQHSIRELVSIPVFDILVSYYDIFNILKLTESLNDSYCMVCYPSLAEKARNYYMSTEVIPAPAVTGTPEESTQRIVMQVFREENYNQSRTAARLGISRTTLWRMLKDN